MLQPRQSTISRQPFSLLPLLLLPHLLSAQDSPSSIPPPDITPLIISPTPTDNANYAPNSNSRPPSTPGNGDDGRNDGLLNYYFLLLVVFVVVIIIIYWSLSRKRKANQARQHTTQQDALAMDLNGWRRWRRGGAGSRELRIRDEEGLNERGEAPPPYIKEPERVHVRDREEGDMELEDWERRSPGKPPDYREREVGGSGLTGMRR